MLGQRKELPYDYGFGVEPSHRQLVCNGRLSQAFGQGADFCTGNLTSSLKLAAAPAVCICQLLTSLVLHSDCSIFFSTLSYTLTCCIILSVVHMSFFPHTYNPLLTFWYLCLSCALPLSICHSYCCPPSLPPGWMVFLQAKG